MKKLVTTSIFTFFALLTLISTATATTIIDGGHTIGLYGVQWENGIPQETRFPEFITLAGHGSDTEIILENDWLDKTLGGTGFIMVANWHEEGKTVEYEYDYQGNTIPRFNGPILTALVEDWHVWGFAQTFSGGTVLDDITRMFVGINYGDTFISEEITRTHSTPVPEPATLLLFGFGLLGIAKFRRKKLA